LLEQLGVRWFMPGDFGRVIPEARTVRVKTQVTTQGPSFPTRWAAGYAGEFKIWQRRMRMGGPHFLQGRQLNSWRPAASSSYLRLR